MKKISTSKLLLFADYSIALLLVAIVILGAFLEKDMSQVAMVASAWIAQLGISSGFYYWKSKNENRSKEAMKLVKKLAKEHGIENVISLAEIILKE